MKNIGKTMAIALAVFMIVSVVYSYQRDIAQLCTELRQRGGDHHACPGSDLGSY